jgi:hypothetical protein
LGLPGGYSKIQLDKADKNIDFYLRTQLPELKNAELIDVESQVVNGINYIY